MSNLTFAKRQTRGATCDDGTHDVKVCVRTVKKSATKNRNGRCVMVKKMREILASGFRFGRVVTFATAQVSRLTFVIEWRHLYDQSSVMANTLCSSHDQLHSYSLRFYMAVSI
jgi:hypothetical protein